MITDYHDTCYSGTQELYLPFLGMPEPIEFDNCVKDSDWSQNEHSLAPSSRRVTGSLMSLPPELRIKVLKNLLIFESPVVFPDFAR
jgi:hypothetical protein